MKKLSLKLLVVLFLSVSLSGCEKEESTNSSSCEFSDVESDAYYNLAVKFGNSPTKSNCAALKQASFKLIEKFKNCDATTKAEIAQLTQQWNSINCDNFN